MIFVQIVCFLIVAYLAFIVLAFAVAFRRGFAQFVLSCVLGVCTVMLIGKNHHLSPEDFEFLHTIFWIIGGCVLGLVLLEYWPRKGAKQ